MALTSVDKKAFHPQHDTIVVVGAGVAAMGFVRGLLANNVPPNNITVVESASAAGGKVTSVHHEGRSYEMGAQVIIPKLYAEIEALKAEFGLNVRALPRGTAIDASTGSLAPVLNAQEQAQLTEQLGRYLKMYSELWHQPSARGAYRLLDPLGLLNLHPSLRVTWPELVRTHGFEMIDRVLASLLTGANYRDNASPAPASRIVRVLRPEIFQSLFVEGNGAQIFAESGYQELWRRVAADLAAKGVKFAYDTAVERVERSSSGPVRTTVLGKTGRAELASDHVIYTGNLGSWTNVLADCTPEEKALFDKVVNSDFRSYLVQLDNLASSKLSHLSGVANSSGVRPHIFGKLESDGSRTMVVGEPVLLLKPHADANVAIVYLNGDASLTQDEANKRIVSALAKLGVAARVITSRQWAYFPRPLGDAQTIDQGIMASQGRGGAWLAGSYFAYEATHEAFRNGREFAQLLVDGKL